MAINPATDVGKVRLRIGDWSDLPLLPDEVIEQTILDCGGSLPRAAALCSQYILGVLSARTHKKIPQLEVWGAEYFDNYVKFLKMTILNPHMMTTAPIPYTGGAEVVHPLVQFMDDWNSGYSEVRL